MAWTNIRVMDWTHIRLLAYTHTRALAQKWLILRFYWLVDRNRIDRGVNVNVSSIDNNRLMCLFILLTLKKRVTLRFWSSVNTFEFINGVLWPLVEKKIVFFRASRLTFDILAYFYKRLSPFGYEIVYTLVLSLGNRSSKALFQRVLIIACSIKSVRLLSQTGRESLGRWDYFKFRFSPNPLCTLGDRIKKTKHFLCWDLRFFG